jgi:hypothetical protein
VAIDQTPSSSTSDQIPKAAIDNEFPTYRAISSLAVFSLIFGLLSVFSFASLWFLLLMAGSTITGWLAIRRIRRVPEILTGRSLAVVGIGVGLLFGLSAITHEVVQEILTSMDARNFANHYMEILKEKPISLALWYEQNIEYRTQNSPDKIVEEIKKAAKSPSGGDNYLTKSTPYVQIKERLKSPGQELHYSKIESKLILGLTTYANVLLEVDGPVTKEFPKKEYALIQLTKQPGAGKYDWVVKEFKFPYTPSSATVEVPHEDDGHGH